MNEINEKVFCEERALFGAKDIDIRGAVFSEGESPLKHSSNIAVSSSIFKWKYPLWYCCDIKVNNCVWMEGSRAGVWYTKKMRVDDSLIESQKNFRRCENLFLKNVNFTDANETLWNCSCVNLSKITAKGDYFAMNSKDIQVENLSLSGNYPFDGAKNVKISDSHFVSKDAFWNSENIEVHNSFISGEYLGWNSKNLLFENCTIESLQGMCYIENLVLKNCRLINTTLAFEYSTVEADISGNIDSVLNPSGGTIRAEKIEKLIIEKDKVDPEKTRIILKSGKKSDFHCA